MFWQSSNIESRAVSAEIDLKIIQLMAIPAIRNTGER
jgi:hypothetical protein